MVDEELGESFSLSLILSTSNASTLSSRTLAWTIRENDGWDLCLVAEVLRLVLPDRVSNFFPHQLSPPFSPSPTSLNHTERVI